MTPHVFIGIVKNGKHASEVNIFAGIGHFQPPFINLIKSENVFSLPKMND